MAVSRLWSIHGRLSDVIDYATNPEKKTLAVMSPKGEAKTGEWVIAGLVVELVNAESGAQLAKHTVAALPCN